MICRKLHNEGSRIAGEHLCLFQDDTGAYNSGDTHKVRAGSNPGSASEQGSRDQGDDGELRAAGNKCRCHNGHLAVAVILNSPGCHNSGNAASRTNEHGDKGFAGEAEFAEDTVHDKSNAGHISAAFQESQENKQYQHLGNESQNRAHAGNDTVKDQALEPSRAVDAYQKAFDSRRNDLSEKHVVGPVCHISTDGSYGNIVNDIHNRREDRQRQDTVGHDSVDLVGNRHLFAGMFFAAAFSNDGGNIIIPLVGDNTFRIVIHLVFNLRDLCGDIRNRGELLRDLVVLFQKFNGKEPSLF